MPVLWQRVFHAVDHLAGPRRSRPRLGQEQEGQGESALVSTGLAEGRGVDQRRGSGGVEAGASCGRWGRPGVLRVIVKLPEVMEDGNGALVSVLNYRCNKVHAFWPIQVTTTLPFTVEP